GISRIDGAFRAHRQVKGPENAGLVARATIAAENVRPGEAGRVAGPGDCRDCALTIATANPVVQGVRDEKSAVEGDINSLPARSAASVAGLPSLPCSPLVRPRGLSISFPPFRDPSATYAAAQLGHSKPTTTLQWYAHWLPSSRRSFVDALDDPEVVRE